MFNAILFCVADGPGLPYNGDLDLTGVGHLILDFLGQVEGQLVGFVVADFISTHNHPEFTSGLYRKGFYDARV